MEVLKRNKTAQRAAFTKALNKLEDVLNDTNENIDELEMCFCLFKKKAETLELTHDTYLDAITDEREFESEFGIVEEYREKTVRLQLRTERFLENIKKKINETQNAPSDSNHTNLTVNENTYRALHHRLPEVELYKFAGDLKNWLTFWNQFRNIHENKNITNADKFHYLIQSTKIRSEAREIIESFPVTDENYPLAIESLVERYGRNELLIDFYVRELIKLVLDNATKKKHDSLSSLYNKLSTQLRALSSLGVTTDQCGTILYPLVESSLPVHVLRSFERQRKIIESEQKVSSLDAIIEFLKSEVQSEEKIKLSRAEIYSFSDRKHLAASQNIPSASDLMNHNHEVITCFFCLRDHDTRYCKKAYYIPLQEKLSIVKKNGLCRICLVKGHLGGQCRSNIRCQVCSKRHLKMFCPSLDCNKSNEMTKQKNDSNEIPKQKNDDLKEKTIDSLHSRATNEVFLQTLVVNIQGNNQMRKVRLMIDTGSSKSYVLRSTAEELGLNMQWEEDFSHSLFGGTKTKVYKHKCYKIYLSSLDGNYFCKLDALDHDVICKDISSIGYGSWIRELKNEKIHLTDTQENSGPIEVLLGADVAGKLFTGKRVELKTGLVAIETKLGWTLMGKVPHSEHRYNANMAVVSMLSQEDLPISSLWDLEILGIRDPAEQKTKEESRRAVMVHFQETVRQRKDGRYEVNMPWKIEHPLLPENYELSMKRLESTTKKLEKIGYREKYHEVFNEWLQEGVIEEVLPEQLSLPVAHYIPHRPVIKETSSVSSMKIRPVFDASAKLPNHPSLNDCLETGINLIETIPSILARFRLHEIGVISDIRRAFLQIYLNEKDRDVLRFLWFNNDGTLKTFRHTRVVFGVTCSPFLLMAVIDHHLSKELWKKQYPEELLNKLRDSFYVDNCVTSVKTVLELNSFIESATDIMKEGMFDLRGWENTVIPTCSSTSHKSHVLGLIWDKNSDTLEIDYESMKFDETEKITKRKILSIISRIFDPIGFLSPAMIQAKILLQDTWKTKESWDEEVNEEIKTKFLKWLKQLHHLKNVKISRWLGVTSESHLSIHTFVDASQTAFSACIFIRSETPDGVVKVQLLQAKSRITPLKKITIPRLELMAATIGARLFESIKNALKINNYETFFWTDSSTVLTWITRQETWSVFVNNRVTEIRKHTAPENWLHIPGNQNPADLLTRGCGSKQLQKSMWWQGPAWLKKSKEQWPKSEVNINEKEVEMEKRRTVVSANNSKNNSVVSQLATKFSKFSMMIRVLAWMLRFRVKSKDLRRNTHLTNEELMDARKILFRSVQKECFADKESRKSLRNLEVYEDEEGLLRLKSRLIDEDETRDFISPIILPSKHIIIRRFVEQEHIANKHAGTSTLLTILRERFWVLRGKRTIRSVINECISCKKQKVKNLEVPFPPLPKDRTKISAVFQVSGVDLAGPLLTKSKEKVWIVLFSCAVFRAVHLELIPSLSTNALIQAIRRFVARRGRISVLYSDNGSNFTGLNTALKQLDWKKIENAFEVNEIHWKFNPPSSPWWGGFWERLIGILKDLLKKNLGRSSLTYEELQTLVCECEGIMNSRPLTYVSEETEFKTLTPSMFLQDLRVNDLPDLDQIEKINIVKRYRYLQKVREHLKQRFKKEYLGFLRSSVSKRHDKINMGDIVLISADNKKRLYWNLGRVLELFPGKDGVVRLVKLKTLKGNVLRPVQRLYPLEIKNEHEPVISDHKTVPDQEPPELSEMKNDFKHDPVYTRSGRLVKPVKRLEL